jgi:hypothetical protein
MSTMDAIAIFAICVAFLGFALVLAWAEYQTRHIGRGTKKSADRDRPQQTIVRQAKERAPLTASGGRARETARS